MTVYFANSGVIDLDVIRVMGASIKEQGAIGMFGTGLKYAIATLLRTGHKVGITLEFEHYEFEARPTMIRGKEFQVIYMNDEKLGITTDLGRNWKVEHAYRELHSNCLDEGGEITDRPVIADTVISVSGPDIMEAYFNRHKIFLSSKPKFVQDMLEIHPGKTNIVYYRGVAVYKMPKLMAYTYNFLMPMQLTEDRTLSSSWDINYKLETILPRVPDEAFASRIIRDINENYVEFNLDYELCADPSEEFLDIVQKYASDETMSQSAKGLLHKKRDVKDTSSVELTEAELKTMNESLEMLKSLDAILNISEITVVQELGPNVMACVRNGKIYVTRRTIANGRDFLMITLYEEFIHRNLGYADCSRGMQQHLFDKILQLVRELKVDTEGSI